MNRFWQKPLLLVIFFCAALAALDFTLRLFSRLFSEVSAPVPAMDSAALLSSGQTLRVIPNMNATIPAAKGVPGFTIQTNSSGLRMAEVNLEKTQGIARIAVMGDSIAFGWGVSSSQAFPNQLAEILNEGKEQFEIVNFAAPGYTTFQGIRQYEKAVQAYQPDVLILAYGLYDFLESRVTEKQQIEMQKLQQEILSGGGFWSYLSSVSFYANRRYRRQQAEAQLRWQNELEKIKQNSTWQPKVSPEEFESNLTTIINRHKSNNGKVILVHDNFLNFNTEPVLKQLAEKLDVPLLDVRDFFNTLGGVEERQKIADLDLLPTKYDPLDAREATRCLLRVFATAAESKPIYVVGALPELGDGRPHRVQLYDDRTHGDEKAGDQVWSLAFDFPSPRPFVYGFTESGPAGEWGTPASEMENTRKNEVFYYRFQPADIDEPYQWTSPVHLFGRPPYSHLVFNDVIPYPNEMGHKAIARRLAHVVREMMPKNSSIAQSASKAIR